MRIDFSDELGVENASLEMHARIGEDYLVGSTISAKLISETNQAMPSTFYYIEEFGFLCSQSDQQNGEWPFELPNIYNSEDEIKAAYKAWKQLPGQAFKKSIDSMYLVDPVRNGKGLGPKGKESDLERSSPLPASAENSNAPK